MAITDFYIRGYRHLLLRSIKEVHITPKSKLQVLLGTNGSGKTALMNELSQLIADHTDYEDDGYKRIKGVSKGRDYECICDFSGPKKHYSIEIDGKMVYEGHSSTAYNAHCKHEFGMTHDIHAVRIGTKTFTSMSKEARREWFTNMSPQDYTYAIGYYNRLSAATRDVNGSIKRINKRLMEEKEKIIDAETEKTLRKEIEELTITKTEMIRNWHPAQTSVEQALSSASEIEGRLLLMTKAFDESLKYFCNAKGYTSQQEIWDDIGKTQSELAVVESQVSSIHEEIEVNERLIRESMLSAGKDKDSIKAKIADVSRSLLSAKLIQFIPDWESCAKDALIAYESVVPELIPIMDELVEDPQFQYTGNAHKANHDKLQSIQKLIEGHEFELNKVNSSLEILNHRAQTDHTECPECKHTWIRGYDATEHKNFELKRDSLAKTIEDLKIQYNDIHALLEVSAYQLQLFNQIALLARANPILETMWKGLTDKGFIRINPKSAIEYVRATKVQIENNIDIINLKEELTDLEQQLESAASTSNINCQELQDKNALLEIKLHTLQSKEYFLQKSLAGYKKAQKSMEFQERFVIEAEDLISKHSEWIKKAELANHHTAINAVMSYLENEIAERENALSRIEYQHRLINTLEQDVEELKKKEVLMKAAMTALSPSKGIIAKGLTGFINHFIAQMNAVIEKVWLYPLVINPIKLEDDTAVDLDYKFSFNVDDKPAGKDVSQGSGAQKEIFDLAFKIVSMMHLGLEESEVFLDEFSIKMDYAHRREAMKLITDLVTNSNFSQIFMISHYENSYGTLSDADITVLCSENIQLPPDLKYNVNASITKK